MALVVVNSHWMALSQHSLSLDGAFSKKRATWRQTTPSNDSRRHKTPTGAKQRRRATKSAKKCHASGRSSLLWIRGRAARGNGTSRARATFRGAKPITRNGRNASHKPTCARIAPPAEAPGRARPPIQGPRSTRAALRARAARAEDPRARGGGKSDQGTIGCALRWTGNSQD
jgi:hypothetical protein